MQELIPLVTSAHDAWKELDLEGKKRAWDDTVKAKLDGFKEESGVGKRRLGEQTKRLRAMGDEDKLKGMGALIRAYQEEIDKANQRYEFTESLHNSIWTALQHVQDPAVLLNTTMKTIREEEAEKQKAAAEAFRVRKELGVKTKQLEEATEKLAQGPQGGAQSTQGNDPRLAAAMKRIEEMEADRVASIEQFKKAATALARVGELERLNAGQADKLKELEAEKEKFAGERDKLKELEAEREKLAKALAEFESKNKVAQTDDSKLADLEIQLEEAKEDKKELQEAFEQEKERASAAEQAGREKLEKLQQLSKQALRRVEELEALAENSKKQVEQLESEKKKSDITVQELQLKLGEKEDLVGRLNDTIESAKASAGQAGKQEEELQGIQNQLEETTRIKEELERKLSEEIQRNEETIQRLEQERDAVKASHGERGDHDLEQLKSAEQARDESNAKVNEKEAIIESLGKQLEAEKQAAAKRNEEKDKEITDLNARIIELEIEAGDSDVTGEEARLKEELEAANEAKEEAAKINQEKDIEITNLNARIIELELEADGSDVAGEVTRLKEELETARAEAVKSSEEKDKEINNLNARIIELEIEADGSDAADEVARIKEELETARGEARRAKDQAETLKQELSDKEALINQATDDHKAALEKGAQDAELRLEALQAEIADIKAATAANAKEDYAKQLEDIERSHKERTESLENQSRVDAELKQKSLQEAHKLVEDNTRKIAELEKKHQDAISENLLNQELIQQQLHTIAQLKGEEEENAKGATPRASGNFQDSLVEELTQLVGSLRENNEKLTLDAQAHEEEYAALKEKVRERDEKISSLVANLNGNDSVEELRNANQQLTMEVHNKSLILERLMDENEEGKAAALAERDLRIQELEESELTVKQSLATAESRIQELTAQLESLASDTEKEDKAAALAERDLRIRELEENELNARQSVATAESHIIELTTQLESLNDSVRQLEIQLDNAKEEGRDKDEKLGDALAKMEASIKHKDDLIKSLEQQVADSDGKNTETLIDHARAIEALKSQNSTLVAHIQVSDKNAESLQATVTAQIAKIQELEQQLQDDVAARSKSTDAALLDAKRKIDSLSAALEAKDVEVADLKAKSQEGIKQLVAQNAELLVQSERNESIHAELERNLAELANSYRQLSEKSEADTQQFHEALTSSKQHASKSLQSDVDSIKQEYEGRISKLKNDYETKLANIQSSPSEMHDISLNAKYDELFKESQLMHRSMQQLEAELENAKEALRKKDEERSLMQSDEAGDPWARMGMGGNAVCYAPVVALSYWRRWWGRPANVHTS